MSSTDDRHGDEQTDARLAAEYAKNHPRDEAEEVPDLMAALMASVSRIKAARVAERFENHPKPDTTEEQK